MDNVIYFVGLWILESKPKPVLYIPHDCILELTGTCQGCEDVWEWNSCMKYEWIDDYSAFFKTCSSAQAIA